MSSIDAPSFRGGWKGTCHSKMETMRNETSVIISFPSNFFFSFIVLEWYFFSAVAQEQ